jgi:ATP-dependent DNA helicase RecQ
MLIHEVIAYSESSICRRRFLLHYFGETYQHNNCNNCDNCRNPKQAVEGRSDVAIVLALINDTKETHDLKHIVNIITGHSSQEIKTFKHEKLKLFGKGKDKTEHYWASVVRQTQILNYVVKDIEDYGVLKLTETGKKAIKTLPSSIMIYLNHEFENTDEGEFVSATASNGALDNKLLSMLKDLRKQVAKQSKVPTYVIFQESSLEDMATQYPINMDDLGKIMGVSQGKALRYGKEFLKLIKEYCEENDIDRPSDMVIKQLANKSAIKVFIIQNTDKKLPLPDIAKLKGIKMGELINELDSIVTSGTKLNIDYYINDVLDEEVQEEIFEYFMESETDDLQVAFDEFGGDFELEELQLMRIKFMSEMAN